MNQLCGPLCPPHQYSSFSHHLFLPRFQPLTQVLHSSSWDRTGRASPYISNYLQGFPDPSWLVRWLRFTLSLTLMTPSPSQSNFTQLPCFKQTNSFICVQFGPFSLFTATLWGNLLTLSGRHPLNWLHPSHPLYVLFPLLLSGDFSLFLCDTNNLAAGTGRTIHHLP